LTCHPKKIYGIGARKVSVSPAIHFKHTEVITK
jgi:hypothetical protein